MRIKAVRASNSDNGGRRRTERGHEVGVESRGKVAESHE